jgi:V8-like Glu-specific endopeptidase
MNFIEIQQKLVKIILRMQVSGTFAGRSSLLQGLPDVPLERSEGLAQLDLNEIVGGLHRLGRLTRNDSMRPVIVVVNNALSYAPEGSEIAEELREVKALLEEYYGGDVQPKLAEDTVRATSEALIFGVPGDTRVDFAFIDHAHLIARSIARLTVPRIVNGVPVGQAAYGTGWIIAPGILMTNHHVIEVRDGQPANLSDFQAQAERVTADFDYHTETGGATLKCQGSKLLTCSRELDYAVIELEQAEKIADRQPIPVVPAPRELHRGARVNIVQHPQGGPLRFAIRNNFFVRPSQRPAFVLYQTDTEPGASGSPACNDDWQVIALHHASLQVPSELVPQNVLDGQLRKVTVLNEAVQIHEILDDLPPELKQRILQAK